MTCAEHKQVEDTKALEEYKAANGTKVCPSCKALFEKKDGCNHIKCISCQIHICWVCLETFPDSGACYAHLSEIHGGNGLEADVVDINEDPGAIDVEIQHDLFREIQMRRHEELLNLRALELLLPQRIAPLDPLEAAAEAAALPHDAPVERERFQALHRPRGGPPVPDPRAWDHVEAAMEAVLGDDAPVECEGFPAGVFGGPRDGLPAPPELRRFGHVHAVAEAVALPRDAPVERERFPARAFGGPRGFRGGFRGGLRGRFRGPP
jgi:LSD1 subclass zinc finger protein